jgi:hypothetical protein
MFSLCIATIDRYDNFLNKYLLDYLDNNLINEIVITDENGNDVKKIELNLKGHKNFSKLVMIINDTKLGPFLNKYKACKLAKNEWIVLIDSDNFANIKYFETAKEYILKNVNNHKNIILAPSKAKPNFDYSHLNGFIYKNGDFKKNRIKENNLKKSNNSQSMILMNTGNYVLNKYLIDNLDLSKELNNISNSSSCDVIYFNTLLFEQLDLNLHVVPNLEYDHVVHNGSIYIQTHSLYRNFANIVHQRYNKLL